MRTFTIFSTTLITLALWVNIGNLVLQSRIREINEMKNSEPTILGAAYELFTWPYLLYKVNNAQEGVKP